MRDLLLGYEDDARREEAQSRMVQFDELEAQKAFEIGRFYEKQKQYKSAALYYRRVSQSTGTSAAVEAQERLAIVEGHLADEPASTSEQPARGEPTAAVGEEESRKSRSIFGGRLFGRKKRAEEEAARSAAVVQAPPAEIETAAATPRPVSSASNPVAGASTSSGAARSVAAVAPGATQVSKRKGYYVARRNQIWR